MNIGEALFLGLFQGITEFLPISSSGHLVLAEHFFHLQTAQLLPFDAVLHGGTLFSLFLLFFREIRELLLFPFFSKKATPETKILFFSLLLATFPVVFVGFLVKDNMEVFRSPWWVAIFFLVSAFLFFIAEKFPQKKEKDISLRMAFFVGMIQIIALFPGMSRSGTCTAAGMLIGVSRGKATRFSFLLGLPVIAGAFLLATLDILSGKSGEIPLLFPALIGFSSAALSGFLMGKFLLRFFQNHSLYGFSAYLLSSAAGVFFIS